MPKPLKKPSQNLWAGLARSSVPKPLNPFQHFWAGLTKSSKELWDEYKVTKEAKDSPLRSELEKLNHINKKIEGLRKSGLNQEDAKAIVELKGAAEKIEKVARKEGAHKLASKAFEFGRTVRNFAKFIKAAVSFKKSVEAKPASYYFDKLKGEKVSFETKSQPAIDTHTSTQIGKTKKVGTVSFRSENSSPSID